MKEPMKWNTTKTSEWGTQQCTADLWHLTREFPLWKLPVVGDNPGPTFQGHEGVEKRRSVACCGDTAALSLTPGGIVLAQPIRRCWDLQGKSLIYSGLKLWVWPAACLWWVTRVLLFVVHVEPLKSVSRWSCPGVGKPVSSSPCDALGSWGVCMLLNHVSDTRIQYISNFWWKMKKGAFFPL